MANYFFKFLLITITAFYCSSTVYANSYTLQIPEQTTIREISKNPNHRTMRGRDIHVYQFAAKNENNQPVEAKYKFMVQGGLHGNELLTTEFVNWLTKRYARGSSRLNQLAKFHIALDLIPTANPDGLIAAERYNSNGVNLNRNFDVLWGITKENPGESHASEPETQSIKYLFQKNKYTAAVDVHGYVNWIVAPTSPQKLNRLGQSFDKKLVPKYNAWIKALSEEMEALPRYELKTAGGLGDGGAFEDWTFWSNGTMSYCLELKSKSRYAQSYRRSFSDITKADDKFQIDLFKTYELFIWNTFKRAIEIGGQGSNTLVDQQKTNGADSKTTH